MIFTLIIIYNMTMIVDRLTVDHTTTIIIALVALLTIRFQVVQPPSINTI